MARNPGTSTREVTASAFDTLPVSIAILDAAGDIVWTNHTWTDFAAENEGDVWITDSDLGGTAFHVELPAA